MRERQFASEFARRAFRSGSHRETAMGENVLGRLNVRLSQVRGFLCEIRQVACHAALMGRAMKLKRGQPRIDVERRHKPRGLKPQRFMTSLQRTIRSKATSKKGDVSAVIR